MRVSSPEKWAAVPPIFVGVVSLLTYAIYRDECDVNVALRWGAGYFLALLAMIPSMALLSYYLVGTRARRLYRQQVIHSRNTMSWTDFGLKIQSELGSAKMKWSDFYGWRFDAGSFYLLLNEGLYYFIPSRALLPEQSADLERTLVDSGLVRR